MNDYDYDYEPAPAPGPARTDRGRVVTSGAWMGGG
jgi:hypothetical protein